MREHLILMGNAKRKKSKKKMSKSKDTVEKQVIKYEHIFSTKLRTEMTASRQSFRYKLFQLQFSILDRQFPEN